MTTVTKGAAQGDVMIVRCDDVPPTAKPEPAQDGRLILVRGEISGHHHSFEAGPQIAVFREVGAGGGLFFRATAPVTLEHQEHEPITFDPGIYKVLRQRTFHGGMSGPPLDSDLTALKSRILTDLAATDDLRAWDALRVSVLGKSGELTALLKQLGAATPEERRTRGAALNALKTELAAEIEARRTALEAAALQDRLAAETIDVTRPPWVRPQGAIHPISRTIEEMAAIFGAMGFEVGEGLDIQSDWYNFGALNIPAHHPARADQDTFYLAGTAQPPLLLRTQTSDVQVISLLTREPPFRVIAPGRTYRADHDATHSPMFHQCEGIVIDRHITLAHLKGCLIDFLRAYFEAPSLPVRFRASYFPFTEPSMEVDIGWNRRTGAIGGGGDWLEILGSGMVHPRVLGNCGVDAREWQGFAFGMGIERITMLKHGMADLRPFFESDVRWLRHYGFAALAPAMLHEGL